MAVKHHPAVDYATVVDASTQFLDVREPNEVVDDALDGTVNVPLAQLPARVRELDHHRRVVLVCRSGGRSAQAAQFLDSVGFTDVVNLDGGMLALHHQVAH